MIAVAILMRINERSAPRSKWTRQRPGQEGLKVQVGGGRPRPIKRNVLGHISVGL